MALTEQQEKRRAEILEDIIKKRPESNGCTYSSETYWDYDRNYERTRMVPNKKFFGYDPSEITELGLSDGSNYTIREAIIDIYGYKAITQKMNRVTERLGNPVSKYIRDVGVPGLYRVRTSDTSVGHVFAATLDEAKRVADITYGFLIAGKTDRWGEPEHLRISWKGLGTIADLNSSNQYDVDAIKARIESAKETIEKTKRNIEKYEAELLAIQMSELTQLDASMSCDESA